MGRRRCPARGDDFVVNEEVFESQGIREHGGKREMLACSRRDLFSMREFLNGVNEAGWNHGSRVARNPPLRQCVAYLP